MKKDKTILVIGDIMLDKYIYGFTDRISPEASCPIFRKTNLTKHHLGGAANVAAQLALFGYNVYLAGQVANDESGNLIMMMLSNMGINTSLVDQKGKITTLKKRYISEANKQVLRIDEEQYTLFPSSCIDAIKNFTLDNSANIDCIILSDYEKGVLISTFSLEIIKIANLHKIPIVVDVKSRDYKKYSGATIVKGNIKEFSNYINKEEIVLKINDIISNFPELKRKLNSDCIIVTCGSQGIVAIDKNDSIHEELAIVRQVVDGMGAGDIVTSYICMGLCMNLNIKEIIRFSNIAASISVTKFGNAYVNPSEVFYNDKTVSVDAFNKLRGNSRVVFTNGCFDVIHAGHIDLLSKAKRFGDILVVGLNSDESIKHLKGGRRPINTYEYRAKVLSAMDVVDYIISFDETTPLNIINTIRPNILVKGGDYSIDTIVGSDYVLSYGGKVEIIPFIHEISTTQILESGK